MTHPDGHADLSAFGLADMVRLASRLRELGAGCGSVEEFFQRVCGDLAGHLRGLGGEAQTALVRAYGTVDYAALPPPERELVRDAVAVPPPPDLTCLALLGTVGRLTEWNDRRASRRHRVIPLTDERQVERLPMVASLLHELRLDVPALATPGRTLPSAGSHRCGVFHVETARGSAVIPDQAFVAEHDVASVVGFGGVLPTGEVYAIVLFTTVVVPEATAQLFETVALSTTLAALDLLDAPLFAQRPAPRSVPLPLSPADRVTARYTVLCDLLEVHEQVAVSEAQATTAALADVTREAQRYASLAARMELAQAVAEVGLWEWDLRTGVLVWDEHCADLFGITLDEFDGTLAGFDRFAHPDDVQDVHANLAAAIRGGGSVEQEYRVLWRDGTVRRHLSRGSALTDGTGRVVRVLGAVLDVTELRAGADARTRLAAVALRLATAETVAQVTDIVIDEGFTALGAAGGAVMLLSADAGSLDVTMSGFYGPEIARQVAVLPLDFDVPSVRTARTGETLYYSDLASIIVDFPDQEPLLRDARVQAAASFPLHVSGRLLGSLSVTWTERRSFTAEDVELGQALAAQSAQALDRVQSRAAERAAAAAARGMSETLQRSLLTSPPQPPGQQIAVRYVPAAEQVQVGGDWYDAFVGPDGATCLVIGDVTGHDREAAATMGQLRNLLRATAYAVAEPPNAVLAALEHAMAGLDVAALATAVLVNVAQTPDEARRQVWQLRWSNAGHPPPMLRGPDGRTTVLGTAPDLMLGVLPGIERLNSELEVEAGSTLLLYTDGLVERRGEHLDAGLGRLRDAFDRFGDLPLEQLCEALLAELLPADADDDVALLAVRLSTPAADGETAEQAFPARPESVGAARRFVTRRLAEWGLNGPVWDIRQVVSELATNCLLHAGTPFTVRLRRRTDTVRLEVSDGGPRLPRERTYGLAATTGRGIGLVRALSTSWGVDQRQDGKTVWCELPLTAD